MNDIVKHDILSILQKAEEIDCNDSKGFSELSNRTIHNASIFQDEDSITIAVLFYSLAKISYHSVIEDIIMHNILDARKKLEEGDLKSYNNALKEALEEIEKNHGELKAYIKKVINQAHISKGGKLYEHGISISRAAYLLGLSTWELMAYVGKKNSINRYDEHDQKLVERIEYAKKIFDLR